MRLLLQENAGSLDLVAREAVRMCTRSKISGKLRRKPRKDVEATFWVVEHFPARNFAHGPEDPADAGQPAYWTDTKLHKLRLINKILQNV